jgi:hypothetical protein
VPAKIHRIKLTEDERLELESVRDRGSNAARIKRAIALLLADEGSRGPAMRDADILPVTGMSPSTLIRLRERCCEVGPLGALEHKQREKPPREIKITGEVEAVCATGDKRPKVVVAPLSTTICTLILEYMHAM